MGIPNKESECLISIETSKQALHSGGLAVYPYTFKAIINAQAAKAFKFNAFRMCVPPRHVVRHTSQCNTATNFPRSTLRARMGDVSGPHPVIWENKAEFSGFSWAGLLMQPLAATARDQPTLSRLGHVTVCARGAL